MPNCETFSIKLMIRPEIFAGQFQEYPKLFPVQDVPKIFTYLPNLKTIYWMVAAVEDLELNNKVFAEIFPKCSKLKQLGITLEYHDSVENFCDFVEKSSGQLESLNLTMSRDVELLQICKIFCTLPSLLKLKRIDLGYHHHLSVTNDQIRSLPNQTSEITIREVHLSNPKLEHFHLTFHFITNVTCLYLTMYRYDRSQWTPDNFINLHLDPLKKIQYLEISTLQNDQFTITWPTIFKVFPNLITLIIDWFENEIEDIPEMKTMKKLVVKQGLMKRPRMLPKMPNLRHLEMEWSTAKEERTSQIKTIMSYLPSCCKLFEDGKQIELN